MLVLRSVVGELASARPHTSDVKAEMRKPAEERKLELKCKSELRRTSICSINDKHVADHVSPYVKASPS